MDCRIAPHNCHGVGPTLGQVPAPGKLEGGDFFPAGRELCFVGLGQRTNARAVGHMLHRRWFGTQRVAVVKGHAGAIAHRRLGHSLSRLGRVVQTSKEGFGWKDTACPTL